MKKVKVRLRKIEETAQKSECKKAVISINVINEECIEEIAEVISAHARFLHHYNPDKYPVMDPEIIFKLAGVECEDFLTTGIPYPINLLNMPLKDILKVLSFCDHTFITMEYATLVSND